LVGFARSDEVAVPPVLVGVPVSPPAFAVPPVVEAVPPVPELPSEPSEHAVLVAATAQQPSAARQSLLKLTDAIVRSSESLGRGSLSPESGP
jgi:hypothetical protein